MEGSGSADCSAKRRFLGLIGNVLLEMSAQTLGLMGSSTERNPLTVGWYGGRPFGRRRTDFFWPIFSDTDFSRGMIRAARCSSLVRQALRAQLVGASPA
jgi:hypothetical protein